MIKDIETQQIELAKLETNKGQVEGIKKNPRNIRQEDFEKLKKSISERPDMLSLRELIVYPNGDKFVVICGNMRLRALRELKYKTAPCKVIPPEISKDDINAILILDNSQFGEWDYDLLANEWDYDLLDGWCIDIPDIEKKNPTGEAKEDDFDPDAKVETVCKRGDIWQLGNHRLMCGDSTDAGDVALLMDGQKATLFLTDPPYGVAIGDKNKMLNEKNGSHSIETNIANDNISTEALYKVLVNALSNGRNSCADDAAYYVFSPQGGELCLMMMMMMKDAGLYVRHMLIWVKSAATFSMGRLDYDYKHEPIFYTWTKSHHFYRESYQTSVFEDEIDIDKLKKDEMRDLLKKILADTVPTSVIKEDKPLRNDLHPTMKPVKLIGRLMTNSSQAGEIVLDLFGGSGTTMIAAEQLGRKCYMMELDEHYCDVIIARWEKLTGEKAERVKP
jgi:DNA modification methylase